MGFESGGFRKMQNGVGGGREAVIDGLQFPLKSPPLGGASAWIRSSREPVRDASSAREASAPPSSRPVAIKRSIGGSAQPEAGLEADRAPSRTFNWRASK